MVSDAISLTRSVNACRPQHLGGRGVGREERLDRQLRQRDVDRRAEDRRGREQRQRAGVGDEAQRHDHAGIFVVHVGARRLRAAGRRIGGKLVEQLDQLARPPSRRSAGAAASADARAIRPRFSMRGASPFGCRLSRSTFTGGCSSDGSAAREQRRHRGIVRDQRPVPVDRDRRIGLVPLEHEIDRLARRLQRRIAERRAAETPARSRPRPAARCARAAARRAARRAAAPSRARAARARFRGSSGAWWKSRLRARDRAG